MAKLAFYDFTQIDAYFSEYIAVGIQPLGLVDQLAARRVDGLVSLVITAQISHEIGPFIRLDDIDLDLQAVVIHGVKG